MPLLKITDSTFYNSLTTPYLGAKELPVIGDGNCAFLGMIGAAVLGGMFSTKRAEKITFLNFIRTVYEKNRHLAIALRPSNNNYNNLEQIDADFRAFFEAVEQANFEEPFSFWQDSYKLYFPTELNTDRRTYKYPPRNAIIKFLALCLRFELATNLQDGSLGLSKSEASQEHKAVDINSGESRAAAVYMQNEYNIFPAVFFEGQGVPDNTARRDGYAVVNLKHSRDHYVIVLTPETIASANQLHQQLEQQRVEQQQARGLEMQRQEYERLQQQNLLKKQDHELALQFQENERLEQQHLLQMQNRDRELALQFEENERLQQQYLLQQRDRELALQLEKERLQQQQLLEMQRREQEARELEQQRQEYQRLNQEHLRKQELIRRTANDNQRPNREMTYQFNRAMKQAALLTTVVGCVGLVVYGLSKLYSRPGQ